MKKQCRTCCFAFCVVLVSVFVRAAEPVDKELIPPGRALLDYLASIYGKRVLAGINGTKNAATVRQKKPPEKYSNTDIMVLVMMVRFAMQSHQFLNNRIKEKALIC